MQIVIIDSSNETQSPIQLQVVPETDVATLKSLIELECNIPVIRQHLTLPGISTMQDNDTLAKLGVHDNDVLTVEDKKSPGSTSPSNAFRTMVEEQATRLMAQYSNPAKLRVLESTQPTLAAAIKSKDKARVTKEIEKSWQAFNQSAVKAVTDPLSAEGQEYVMQQIRHEAIEQNRQYACEFLPESFGDVVMLYIKVEVNGVPILAFVDSGAQSTIMSEDCARKCNVERIIDRRYMGTARGVGQCQVVGRIHLAQIKCEGVFFPASFTILENQQMDLLFGLDLLRRHQCCIDLRHNCLRLGAEAVAPFLSESEIRDGLQEVMMDNLLGSVKAEHPPTFGVQPQSLSLTSSNILPNKEKRIGASSISPASSAGPDSPSSYRGPPSANHASAVTSSAAASSKQLVPPQRSPVIPPPDLQRSRRVHTQEVDPSNVGERMIEDNKVDRLVELGFDRETARKVLRQCKGDTELAAAHLFQSTTL